MTEPDEMRRPTMRERLMLAPVAWRAIMLVFSRGTLAYQADGKTMMVSADGKARGWFNTADLPTTAPYSANMGAKGIRGAEGGEGGSTGLYGANNAGGK